MPETTGLQTITVRCPAHNIDLETDKAERIVCPAGPHALAQGFPNEGFWEYCCDCQRFWPSNLNHGGKSEAQCPICDRQIGRRYLCISCKVVSVESDDRTVKRKRFTIPNGGGVSPECPGCSFVPTGTLHHHKCEEAGAIFTTPRNVCPFCEKPTSEKKIEEKIEQKIEAKPRVTAKVKAVVRDQAATVYQKLQVPVCPHCGAPKRKLDDEFCGKCGELFNESPNLFGQPAVEEVKQFGHDNGTQTSPLQNSGTFPLKLVLGIVLGVALLGILITIAGLSVGSNSVEKRLDRAIAAGNMLGPSKENAFDLFYKLQESGASPETLKRYREKLTPLLTEDGRKLIDGLMVLGYEEPDATEWQNAARTLDWAAELNPTDNKIAARASYCNGRAAFLQKQLDQALANWSRATNLDKSWALPVNGIGLIYNSRRDYPSARSYFSDAINREPNWAVPYENMANAYYMEKSRDRAREFYGKAAAKAPDWAKPHVHLADMASEDGDYSTAVSEFEKALSSNAKGLKDQETIKVQERLDKARQRLTG